MNSKNSIFKKHFVKKKMISLIIYGIIFLISTIAFYFVNNSKAKDVLKASVFVIDKDAYIEISNYDLKVQEKDGKYKTELFPIQSGNKVKKYKLVSKQEFQEYMEKYEHKTEKSSQKENNNENKAEEEKKEEKETKNEKQENVTGEVIDNNSEKQDDKNENKKKNESKEENKKDDNIEKEYKNIVKEEELHNNIGDQIEENVNLELNKKEIELTDEQLEEKQIYLIAEYDFKEVNKNKIYNKVISNSIKEATISISGYMPENSEVLLKNEDITEVKERILKNYQDVNKDINLIAAYDIKILSGEKEYEPEDFDEKAKVLINGIQGKEFRIWHIKNDNTIEIIDNEKNTDNIEFKTEGFSIYGIERIDENEDKKDNVTEDKEEIEETTITSVDENEIKDTPLETNTIDNMNTINENTIISGTTKKQTIKRTPRKAPARNLPDSTLEIDDYLSDYYYYMGQNYTDSSSGTNTNTYSNNNLKKITIYYHGFAQGETDNEKKGRISLANGEEQDIIKNIRCAPVKNRINYN